MTEPINFKALNALNTNSISTQTTQPNNQQKITLDFTSQNSKQKNITNKDIETALNQTSGRKAVNFLLEKSPLGKIKPDNKNLGLPLYMTDEQGAGFYETSNGKIRICQQEGEKITGEAGSIRAQYKTDKYEQEMIYDKNGNLKQGKICIRDEFGNIEKQFDLFMDEKGAMTIIH